MKWYAQYLSVFGKPLDRVSEETLSIIRNNIRQKRSDDRPLVTVAVIAHNEETTMLSCLWSLSENICDFPIEIIGVDNNSTDRTKDVFASVGIRCFWEEKKSCGYARQCGLDHAKGKYFLSIDSDMLYPKSYIQTMVKHLRESGTVAVSSRYDYIPDKNHNRLLLTIYECLRDMNIFFQAFQRPEISVRGAVLGYVTKYGRQVGYRVDIIAGEDGSMALGLKNYGRIKLIYGRKARAVTYIVRGNAAENLYRNFFRGVVKSIKNPLRYFTKKSKYEDRPSNKINQLKIW